MQPSSQLEEAFATVSFVQQADTAGFPEFPLSITEEQSKEMADSMMHMVGGSHPNSTNTAQRLAEGLEGENCFVYVTVHIRIGLGGYAVT